MNVSPLLAIARNWRRLLTSEASEEEIEMFRQHERTGRVLGDEDFQKRLEKILGRILRRQTPGPQRASTRDLCMASPEVPAIAFAKPPSPGAWKWLSKHVG